MPVACPHCGSRFLRDSQPRDAAEKRGRLLFKSPLRCLDCKTRFVSSTLIFSDFLLARCPKCCRMDLNGWTGKTYHPSLWMGLKAKLGANRWRCEYCRINFVSFRKRAEVFTFRRWERMNAGAARAQGRARANEKMARLEGERLVADLSGDSKTPFGANANKGEPEAD